MAKEILRKLHLDLYIGAEEFKFEFWANASSAKSMRKACGLGAEGIGLIRTENIENSKESYIKLLETAGTFPKTFRVIDSEDMQKRYTQNKPECIDILSKQIDNISSAQKELRCCNVSIMIPMRYKEVIDIAIAKKLWDINLGIMLDTKDIYIPPLYKENISFFAFGTNDLTANILNIKRNNTNLMMDESFWKLDKNVAETMRDQIEIIKENFPHAKIGVCGRHASNPENYKLFKEMGVDYLSCEVAKLEQILAMRKSTVLTKGISFTP